MGGNVLQYGMNRIACNFVSNRNKAETGERHYKSALHRFLLYCVIYCCKYSHYLTSINSMLVILPCHDVIDAENLSLVLLGSIISKLFKRL